MFKEGDRVITTCRLFIQENNDILKIGEKGTVEEILNFPFSKYIFVKFDNYHPDKKWCVSSDFLSLLLIEVKQTTEEDIRNMIKKLEYYLYILGNGGKLNNDEVAEIKELRNDIKIFIMDTSNKY